MIRRALGPCEHWATNLYRRCFVDLRRFADDLAAGLCASRILDVGCGEGQSTEALAAAFPETAIVGVDVTERVGRLFRGDPRRVRFVSAPFDAFADRNAKAFDLAVVCDVLHHVPPGHRHALLAQIASCVRNGGWIVVKEWQPRRSVIHLMCYLGDRYLTGDRVRYAAQDELHRLLNAVPSIGVVRTAPVRPWANNVAIWSRVCESQLDG